MQKLDIALSRNSPVVATSELRRVPTRWYRPLGGAVWRRDDDTDWDGQGLPPAAMARMERGRSSAVRSSLLSVPGHVGVEACGFSVVGEVMGCIVSDRIHRLGGLWLRRLRTGRGGLSAASAG